MTLEINGSDQQSPGMKACSKCSAVKPLEALPRVRAALGVGVEKMLTE